MAVTVLQAALRLSVQEPEGGADAQSWNQDQEPGPEADGGDCYQQESVED